MSGVRLWLFRGIAQFYYRRLGKSSERTARLRVLSGAQVRPGSLASTLAIGLCFSEARL
jgi:hypothetical protein